MSGHLCLKWNNHSSAFLKSISCIQLKEKYCDATIACQGKYFPVHRFILSTCSEYFNEMFDRIQCPHPYIVFKDIEPREMELLLNYMYIGEINVVQELLPTLLKAAEALKIRGLAVPDDLPIIETSTKKRKSTSNADSPQRKRKTEEHKARRKSPSELNTTKQLSGEGASNLDTESKDIKEEPIDSNATVELPFRSTDRGDIADTSLNSNIRGRGDFPQYADSENTYIKSQEEAEAGGQQVFSQSIAWSEYGGTSSGLPDLPPVEDGAQDDIEERPLALGSVVPSDAPQDIQPSETVSNEWCLGLGKIPTFREHPGQPLRYYCPSCSYCSTTSYRVTSHIRYRHTRERPFSCPICSKRFTEKIGRDRHVRVHTGERPFECRYCQKRFGTRFNLQQHQMRKNGCCTPVEREGNDF